MRRDKYRMRIGNEIKCKGLYMQMFFNFRRLKGENSNLKIEKRRFCKK